MKTGYRVESWVGGEREGLNESEWRERERERERKYFLSVGARINLVIVWL